MIDIQRKRRILNSIWMCLKLKVIKTDLVYNLIQLLGWAGWLKPVKINNTILIII